MAAVMLVLVVPLAADASDPSDIHIANSSHPIHQHNLKCRRICCVHQCNHHIHSGIQTVDNISRHIAAPLRRIGPSTRAIRHKYSQSECIHPTNTGTVRPSNCHAISDRCWANIFRSVHRSCQRIPCSHCIRHFYLRRLHTNSGISFLDIEMICIRLLFRQCHRCNPLSRCNVRLC